MNEQVPFRVNRELMKNQSIFYQDLKPLISLNEAKLAESSSTLKSEDLKNSHSYDYGVSGGVRLNGLLKKI